MAQDKDRKTPLHLALPYDYDPALCIHLFFLRADVLYAWVCVYADGWLARSG